MKNSKLTTAAILASMLALSGCGPKPGGKSTSAKPVSSVSDSVTSEISSPSATSAQPTSGTSMTSATSHTSATSQTTTTPLPTSSSSTAPIRVLTHISAVYNGQPIQYGGSLSKSDFAVTAHFSDSTSEPVAEADFELDYNSVTKEHSMDVTVSYSGQTTVVSVGVNKVALSISAVYSGPVIDYGGTIDKADVAVSVAYSDETSGSVSEFDLEYDSHTSESSMLVTVKALNLETTFEVVINAVLMGIQATYEGFSIYYGGEINKEDVFVQGTYSDGNKGPIAEFDLDYDSHTSASEITVTVIVGDLSDTFQVGIMPVAVGLSATYTGSNIKYGGSITASKVAVYPVMSDGSTGSTKLSTTKYSVSVNTKQAAGTYEGTVTGKGDYAGLTGTFTFTIDRDHLPSGYEAVEAEISRMVTVMNPAVEDPEYHIDFLFLQSSGYAYFDVEDYATEKEDLLEINKEFAAKLDSGATPSSIPYLNEYDQMVAEYFLTASGLEMRVINLVSAEGMNIVETQVFNSSKITYWPTEEIAARVLSIDETTSTVIPEVSNLMTFEFDDRYVVSNGVHIFDIIMQEGATNPLAGYLEGLVNDGWTFQEGGAQLADAEYTGISPDTKIVLELGYNDTAKLFFIVVYKNTLGFPVEEMKSVMEALGSTNDPVVPSGLEFTMFYTDDYYWTSYGLYNIYTGVANPADLQAKFEQAWIDAGWVLVNPFNYNFYTKAAISPDGKVCIEYGIYQNSLFDMYYCPFTDDISWNVEKVAQIVSNLVPSGSTTVVPELAGANLYKFNYNSTYNVGQIYGKYSDTAAAISAYVSLLESNSWTEDQPTSSGDRVFISPNIDMKMTIVDYETYVYLQLESYSAPAPEWPTDAVNALIPSEVRDSLPAYNSEEVTSYEVNLSGLNPAVFMYSTDLATTSSGFVAAYEAAGYVDDIQAAEDIGVEHYLTSPNGDIVVYVYSFESDGIVTAEIEFHPILTVGNLTGYLNKYGYNTTGVEEFFSLISTTVPAPRYETTSYYGYEILYFNIDGTMLEDAKAWALGLGLTLYGSGDSKWTYCDDDYRQIDVVVLDSGAVQIQIWEP